MPMTPSQEIAAFGEWRTGAMPQWIDLRQFCDQAHIAYSTARQMIADGRLRAATCNNGHSYRIPVGELTRVFTAVEPKGSVTQ